MTGISRNTVRRIIEDYREDGSIPVSVLESLIRVEEPRRPDGWDLFTVREYDGFENNWIDVLTGVNWETALECWKKETGNGMKNACYEDLVYYSIFPAGTKMLVTHPNDGRCP